MHESGSKCGKGQKRLFFPPSEVCQRRSTKSPKNMKNTGRLIQKGRRAEGGKNWRHTNENLVGGEGKKERGNNFVFLVEGKKTYRKIILSTGRELRRSFLNRKESLEGRETYSGQNGQDHLLSLFKGTSNRKKRDTSA